MKREVRLTSGDRVLFPDDGITKRDLWDYYDAVAEVLVPHLRDRPFTMKRWREGLAGGSFFQKQVPKGTPSWIPTRRYTTRTRDGRTREVDFALVNCREALLWMVQMHCIDMNAWYSRVDLPHRPDFVLFDIDPPDDASWPLAVEVAHLIHDRLEELGLASWAKTSGSTGIHLVVPIARRSSWDDTYEFAGRVARGLEAEHPGMLTTQWRKEKRTGVLVDHRQNAWGKTIASVYSVRPRRGAPVSTPLGWRELTPELDFRELGMREALARVERDGDRFAPVLEGGQALGPVLRRLRESDAKPPT
ncbi:MAG: non-homologous end-joining DNA ligase [Pseudomonadota bacterium]